MKVKISPILLALAFILISSFIFLNSVNAAEVSQYHVTAGTVQTQAFNLQKGDELIGSISVTGGNHDINFWVTDPSGQFIIGKQGIVSGKDFSFKVSRSGAYVLNFDNSFSLLTSKVVTLSYDIKRPITSQITGGGGCLIATATYGSELAPQVQMLRELRDGTLLQTNSGTSFMDGFNQFYYSFSPTIADFERENPMFKETVKLIITPMLVSLSILNYVDIDSEEEMLGYGIGVILLNIGMYFVTPIALVLRLKRNE